MLPRNQDDTSFPAIHWIQWQKYYLNLHLLVYQTKMSPRNQDDTRVTVFLNWPHSWFSELYVFLNSLNFLYLIQVNIHLRKTLMKTLKQWYVSKVPFEQLYAGETVSNLVDFTETPPISVWPMYLKALELKPKELLLLWFTFSMSNYQSWIRYGSHLV